MRCFTTLALALLVASLPVFAQVSQDSALPEHLDKHLLQELPKWLATGEHQDIPWKVHIEKPIETFQLRDLVHVTAALDTGVLQARSVQRKLLFIIKVADENGHWLEDSNFVTRNLEKRLVSNSKLNMESEVFLKPGKYTIGTIVFDSVLDQHNVSLIKYEVPAPKKDPLPELLKGVDAAEFVRGDVNGSNSFAEEPVHLPLPTRRPVRLDLLVDLTTREEVVQHHLHNFGEPPFFRHRPGDHRPPPFHPTDDKTYIISLLQSASVLSALTPEAGCTRVSALDAFKERTLFPPTAAKDLDWIKFKERMLGADKETIDVKALGDTKDEPKFFLRGLEALTGDAHCPTVSLRPLHVLIILSHGLHFRDGSEKPMLEACDCTVYYLRQSDTIADSDDLPNTLAPLSPRMLDYHDPNGFRQRLADLVKQIETLAQ